MMRTRVVFLSVSVAVVLLFTGALMADRHSREDLFEALGNLAEVVHLVQTEYVDELNQEALSLSLDAGILESVDRSGAVLPSDQVEVYVQALQGPPPYGLCLTGRLDSAAVRHTLAGSPSEDAGLEAWEVIEEINGVNTRGRPLWQIRIELMLLENGGEPATLKVVDRRVDERRDVVLEARPWTVEPLAVEEMDEARVLRLESLPPGAAAELAKTLAEDRGLILDLRNLVWGLEDEALAAADLFVSQGELGRWKGRKAGEQGFEASPEVVAHSLPVVLTGTDTEGVGETLAAALQAAGATVVGVRSAGHAPHMQLVTDGEIHLWMPVGQWLRADGTAINGNGVEPDEVVEAADEEGDEDPVLQRALEILRPALDQAA